MLRLSWFRTLTPILCGGVVGYLAASIQMCGHPRLAEAASLAPRVNSSTESEPTGWSIGAGRNALLALATPRLKSEPPPAPVAGKKPNIVVIFGDDHFR